MKTSLCIYELIAILCIDNKSAISQRSRRVAQTTIYSGSQLYRSLSRKKNAKRKCFICAAVRSVQKEVIYTKYILVRIHMKYICRLNVWESMEPRNSISKV